MCLPSQVDAVRPLYFYRAIGNRFQSTQTVVRLLLNGKLRDLCIIDIAKMEVKINDLLMDVKS